ncbi:hypothetical protein ACFLRM_00710 [Acidobacteriota bacterium]
MTRRFSNTNGWKRYLGNTNEMKVHDLENEKTGENECQIDEIKPEHIKRFSTLFQAHKEKFKDCSHCLSKGGLFIIEKD